MLSRIITGVFVFGWAIGMSLSGIGENVAQAAPWDLLNFKKVEVDPSKTYELTDKNGPWMIMVTTFSGEHAEEDAHNLVLDLRKNFKLNSYIYSKTYDFTSKEQGLGLKPDGSPKVMVHPNGKKVEEVAVLVGDYQQVGDSDIQDDLKKIKQMKPESLKTSKSLTFSEYRKQCDELMHKDKGPLSRAFVATNPLLPKEYFNPKGLDKFLVELNRGIEHDLLNCPGKYTVQVATFKGVTVIDQTKIKEVQSGQKNWHSELDRAAERAHRMTTELRKLGYQAYEFHDREASIVTVGSFDSLGVAKADGTTDLSPEIRNVIQKFCGKEARTVPIPGQPDISLKPEAMAKNGPNVDLQFDIEPRPVEVPKRSIATDYARRAN